MISPCPKCNNAARFVAVVAEWNDYACDSSGRMEEWLAGEVHGVTEYRCAICYSPVEGTGKKPKDTQVRQLHPRHGGT